MATTLATITLDLAPVPVDICITRKDSFPFGFILEQDGSPIDLTGGGALLTVNDAADGSGAEHFSVANTNTFDATGVMTFQPSVANLTLPAKDSYFFDVEWTDAASDIRTIIKGKFVLGADITNP
jgi:hypothetical protein